MRQATAQIGGPSAGDVALAIGAQLREGLDGARPVAIYAAPLTGDVLIAGAHQRSVDALTPKALSAGTALRRSTGGVTVRGGDGIAYVALALLDASTLMRCPPRAILNRNVRGVLQGLRAAGMETNYFGRDYLAFGVQPGVYVGWARDLRGRLLLEFFIGVDRPFGAPADAVAYPAPPEPPFRGRAPTSLSAEAPGAWDFSTIAEAIIETHANQFELEFDAAGVPPTPGEDALRARSLRIRHDELTWSAPRAEAIGFLSAGVALDGSGSIADLRLAGDFMQSEASEHLLSERARGLADDDTPLVSLINGIYASDEHFIEGIKDISSILDAVREAITAAR